MRPTTALLPDYRAPHPPRGRRVRGCPRVYVPRDMRSWVLRACYVRASCLFNGRVFLLVARHGMPRPMVSLRMCDCQAHKTWRQIARWPVLNMPLLQVLWLELVSSDLCPSLHVDVLTFFSSTTTVSAAGPTCSLSLLLPNEVHAGRLLRLAFSIFHHPKADTRFWIGTNWRSASSPSTISATRL